MPPFVRPPVASIASARQRGFTLIEVLVAILVLSFGMLGVVGLQVSAIQANKSARYQSAGVRYARELAETMRANKNVLAKSTGPYLSMNYSSGSTVSYSGNCPAACTTTQSSAAVPWDHTDLANFDVADWWARASAELPGLRVVICADSAPYTTASPPVAQWACTAPASTSAGESVVVKLGWTQQNTDRSATGTAVVNLATGASASPPLIVIPVAN